MCASRRPIVIALLSSAFDSNQYMEREIALDERTSHTAAIWKARPAEALVFGSGLNTAEAFSRSSLIVTSWLGCVIAGYLFMYTPPRRNDASARRRRVPGAMPPLMVGRLDCG